MPNEEEWTACSISSGLLCAFFKLWDLKLLDIAQEYFVLARRVYVKLVLFCSIPVGLRHSILQQAHKGYRAHLASLLVGTGVPFSRGKGGGS